VRVYANRVAANPHRTVGKLLIALTFVADNGNTHGLQMKKSTYLTTDLVLLIE
jgi:hypothetical protein